MYKLEKIEKNISMIFKGKRFFKKMSEGDLSNMLRKEDKCIVQKVTEESISYALFDSWKCFEIWYKSLSINERTFSEVITEGPQKFRLDIDCPKDKWVFLSKYDLLCPLYNLLKQILGHSVKLLIYESIDPEKNKYSFHIVTKNIFLDSSTQCATIANIIKSRFAYKDLIDSSVYKSLQCFRLEGSRKPNSQRFKYIIGTNSISEYFLEGIISNIENCTSFESFYTNFGSPEPYFKSKYLGTPCTTCRVHTGLGGTLVQTRVRCGCKDRGSRFQKKFSYNS